MDHIESNLGDPLLKKSAFLCILVGQILLVNLASGETAPEETAREKIEPEKLYNLALNTSVGLPQPLLFGVQIHPLSLPKWDAFYEFGFFKYPLKSASRSFSDYCIEVGVRYHPFNNWFYTSGELGFRHIGVTVDISNLKQDGVALANTATISLGTYFFGLLAGGEWKLTERLSLGADLGIQFALLHTGGISIRGNPALDDGSDLTVDDHKEMSRISGLTLPQIALFRFIWYI